MIRRRTLGGDESTLADVRGKGDQGDQTHRALLLVKNGRSRGREQGKKKGPTKFCDDRQGIEKVNSKIRLH